MKLQRCISLHRLAIAKIFEFLLSKLVTINLLQLEYFGKICCSGMLTLAIRWYIVWSSVAFAKLVIAIFLIQNYEMSICEISSKVFQIVKFFLLYFQNSKSFEFISFFHKFFTIRC